eukprot:m.1338096 g.1338096  ORF g.1338096 m.1338096 type:complete len:282 (+) comp24884_c0_seq1:247-1092(+)
MADSATQVPSGSSLESVKHVVLVLSGKGGVGKSTVTSQLACALVARGQKVGVLDIDLCGPSIPRMFGLQGQSIHQCAQGWVPVYADKEKQLAVMSIGFLLGGEDEPVVWRGPKKSAMIQQFVGEVYWSELDFLLVDTPPGTSDEHIAVVEALRSYKPDGAVLVTTPQGVALNDVRREASFCKKARIPILGIVENMSGFVCPHCSEPSNVFSTGGGEKLAAEISVPFLGRIPIDPALGMALETGERYMEKFPESEVSKVVNDVIEPLLHLPSRDAQTTAVST